LGTSFYLGESRGYIFQIPGGQIGGGSSPAKNTMKYQSFKQLIIDTKCKYHSEFVGITSVKQIPFVRISTNPDPRDLESSILVCASMKARTEGLVVKGQATKDLYNHNTIVVEKGGITWYKFCGEPAKFVEADLS